MSQTLRQAHRTRIQQFITDPLTGGVVWLMLGVFKILPTRIASDFGAFLGGLLYHVLTQRNAVARKNLSFAFPDKTPAEREQILKETWRHWGRVYAEVPHGETLYHNAVFSGFLFTAIVMYLSGIFGLIFSI